MMSFQTMSSNQLSRFFIKWTWRNNRQIVLFTIVSQLIALALALVTEDQRMQVFADFQFTSIYYNLVPLIVAGCLSTMMLGAALKQQRLEPFQFPKHVKQRASIVIAVLYSAALTLAIILTRYVIGIYFLLIEPEQTILRANEQVWLQAMLVFVWLMMACILGFLYAINKVYAFLVGIVSLVAMIVVAQLFEHVLYIGTASIAVILAAALIWMIRQEEAV